MSCINSYQYKYVSFENFDATLLKFECAKIRVSREISTREKGAGNRSNFSLQLAVHAYRISHHPGAGDKIAEG